MSKSWKRAQREALGKSAPATARELDIMVVLADLIEASPPGQRSAVMTAMLADVRAAQAAHRKGGGR
ncbi:MAG: hypothetical protein ACFE0S_12545 [Rhodospirillales bacterium]